MTTQSPPAPRLSLRDPILIVWTILIAATLLSFWLGTNHGLNSVEARTVIILLVAFIKIRFVGLYFMELRDAPMVLRGLFEGWCVVVCFGLIGFYFLA